MLVRSACNHMLQCKCAQELWRMYLEHRKWLGLSQIRKMIFLLHQNTGIWCLVLQLIFISVQYQKHAIGKSGAVAGKNNPFF